MSAFVLLYRGGERPSTPEGMQQLLSMGMEEGIKAAVGQIDAILAGS